MPPPFNIRERIIELRNKYGMSIYRLSKESSVAYSYLHDLENGTKQNVTVGVIEEICNAFGISLYEFFHVEANSEESDREMLNNLFLKLKPDDVKLIISLLMKMGYS